MKGTKPSRPEAPLERDVSAFFELTYASYLVLPRVILEAMPEDWQLRFVQCLDELRDEWEAEDNYTVKLRGDGGRFKRDPLSEYRHPDPAVLAAFKRVRS